MTKEQLKKEAEKNIFNLKNNLIKVCGKSFQINKGDYTQGYLDGAEPREKRIEELEAQIEKMKQELDTARENANKQEQWEIYSVLNDIYSDNFEITKGVSN